MIDILIINYNSTNYLIKCLNSIEKSLKYFKYAENSKIFILDNASCKSEIALFDKIILQFNKTNGVNFYKSPTNLGFAKGVNKILEKTKNKYIILLNPDTYLPDAQNCQDLNNSFFEKIINFMEKNQDIGVLGPKIFENNGAIQNSARSFPDFSTAFFGRSSFLSKKFPNNKFTRKNLLNLDFENLDKNLDKKANFQNFQVDWVSGACMIIRKQALDNIGFFDDRFFMYWEDADLCKRMWQNNWQVVYFPEVSIYHHAGISSRSVFLSSNIEFHKSAYRFFEKYLCKSFILKSLALSFLASRLCLCSFINFFKQVFK